MSCNPTTLSKVEIRDSNSNLTEVYYIDRDSLKQGIYLNYYEGGRIPFEKSEYKNGVLDGIRTLFYKTGDIEIMEHYKKGKLHGPITTYHLNGKKSFEGNYIDGLLSGKVTTYYASGTRKEEVTFENNEENGPFLEYYENGALQWSGNYLNGDNEFGELSYFDSTGVLIKKMICDSNAICQTTWTLEKGDIVPEKLFND